MSKLATALLLLLVGVAPAGVLDRPSEGPKCRPRGPVGEDMPDFVILLNHEVHDGELVGFPEWLKNDGRQVHSWEMVCWRWVEENYGIQVQSGAWYTLTEEWVEQTRKDRLAALDALVTAQDRHLEQTGEYAASVDDLPGFGAPSDYRLPAHLLVDLRTAAGGWTARLTAKESWLSGPYTFTGATTRMEPLYDCLAFAGEAPFVWEAIAVAEGVELAERKPVCF